LVKTTYFIQIHYPSGALAIADVSKLVKSDYADYEVNRVSVPPSYHRQGYGTKLMTEICSDADEEQVKLCLFAAPYGHEQGMNHQQLQRWYERFGFEVYPLRKRERAKLMIRKPKGGQRARS
jgi:ribosomal protein S18 acetylase RimI-like enzyme